jgi:hypothetical protein
MPVRTNLTIQIPDRVEMKWSDLTADEIRRFRVEESERHICEDSYPERLYVEVKRRVYHSFPQRARRGQMPINPNRGSGIWRHELTAAEIIIADHHGISLEEYHSRARSRQSIQHTIQT